MKRYKLVKNLPTFKKGTKFHISADGNLVLDSNFIVAYAKSTLEKFPKILKDWFEEIPELKRWRGEYGETYWFLSDNGSLYFKTEDNSKIDNYRYLVGNYFKTIEEAKAYKKIPPCSSSLIGRHWRLEIYAKGTELFCENIVLLITAGISMRTIIIPQVEFTLRT